MSRVFIDFIELDADVTDSEITIRGGVAFLRDYRARLAMRREIVEVNSLNGNRLRSFHCLPEPTNITARGNGDDRKFELAVKVHDIHRIRECNLKARIG